MLFKKLFKQTKSGLSMPLPNYTGKGIINLISTIGQAVGYKSKYKTLDILSPSELKNYKNIVFMLVDGLGYEFLKKNGKGSFLNENLKGKIISTFPSSTSSVIPALHTITSPQEHGMTGWNMFIKELESVIISLPYMDRKENSSLSEVIDIKKVFNIKPFYDKIRRKSYIVTKNVIINSDFSLATKGKSKTVGYDNLNGFFSSIRKTIKSGKERKYILAYWPDHDSLCHEHGSESKKVLKNFRNFDSSLKSFLKTIKGTDTVLVIASDHGIKDIPKSKKIDLKSHPKLRECLSIPLCGETRFAYCYVKPSKEKQFKNYIKTRLKHCCKLYKSEDLFKKGFFGLGKPHKNFFNRIGDYTLIMKDNYAIYDRPEYSKKHSTGHDGSHGGLSKEEMHIPLIVIKA